MNFFSMSPVCCTDETNSWALTEMQLCDSRTLSHSVIYLWLEKNPKGWMRESKEFLKKGKMCQELQVNRIKIPCDFAYNILVSWIPIIYQVQASKRLFRWYQNECKVMDEKRWHQEISLDLLKDQSQEGPDLLFAEVCCIKPSVLNMFRNEIIFSPGSWGTRKFCIAESNTRVGNITIADKS